MQIFWHGFSSIRIEAKTGEEESTLLTDPFFNDSGLRFPRTALPDILALSHQDRSLFNLEGVGGTPFIISDPGEYEVKGIFVRGIQDPTAETEKLRPLIYRFDAENISIAFLGACKRALTAHEQDQLGNIDILIIPVGGGNVLDAKVAAGVISTVDPRIVIPIYFDLPGVKEKLQGIAAFCKQLGVCQRQDMPKLKIAKKDLMNDDLLVAVLEKA